MQYIQPNQEFKAHYDKEIQPLLGELEQKRLKCLSRFKLYTILVTIFAIIVLVNLFTRFAFLFEVKDGLGAPAVLIILPFSFIWCIQEDFKKKGRKFVLPKILAYFGNFSLKEEKIFKEKDSKLFKEILPYDSTIVDYNANITQIDDLTIEILDAKLAEKDIDNRVFSTFTGLLIKVSFNKNFKGKTVIAGDTCPIIGEKGLSFQNDKIKDPVFKRNFLVYASDQEEAKNILTPIFMESFLKLNEMTSQTITCTFYEKSMYLTFPQRKDSFEIISLFRSVYSSDEIVNVFNQLKEIFKIIEIIKLDENIGL